MTKYLTYDENTEVCDIETDGLAPTKVHVLCVDKMLETDRETLTSDVEIKSHINGRKAAGAKFVFHNGLHYDGPVLNDLLGTKLSVNDVVDTMVMSMLYNPSIDGGHSLEAWGKRLAFAKVEHEDWSILSPEMIERCQGDVELGKRVYGYLCRKLNSIGFSEEAVAIEHKAWARVRQQRINGFAFDVGRAEELRNELLGRADELYVKLQGFFPPTLELIATYKKAFKKDGSATAGFEEHSERFSKIVLLPDDSYEAYEYVPFDPGSPVQRVAKLLELGWKPKEFTKPSKTHPKGQPQPTRKGKLSPSLQIFVDSLDEDHGVTTLIAWMEATNRATMIQTWINAYNPKTGCIHGQLWLANTLRYKHSAPNTANAPAVKVDDEGNPKLGQKGGWAYECRDLWTTRDPEKRTLIGVDAKGIQLRVLANYLNDAEFTKAILSEDPHTANQQMMELASRALAKTICYAVVMGAGDERISLEARVSLKEAKENKEKFFAKVPGLPKLIAKLKAEQRKTGRITLCSGAKIICHQPHTVIPFLLQGDESAIVKLADIYIGIEARKLGLDVLRVGHIHDELQYDVANCDKEAFKKLLSPAFKKAGEFFNYRLPIECDAKEGLTWAKTH